MLSPPRWMRLTEYILIIVFVCVILWVDLKMDGITDKMILDLRAVPLAISCGSMLWTLWVVSEWFDHKDGKK